MIFSENRYTLFRIMLWLRRVVAAQRRESDRTGPRYDGPRGKRPPPLRMSERGQTRARHGRFILQLVGSMVCGVSIFDTSRQPQPVFSSSNGSFSLRLPNDEM
jgi:hypothetical protein